MDSPIYQGIMLILMIIGFVGIWAWAWSRKRKPEFDEASKLPLVEDDGTVPDTENNGN